MKNKIAAVIASMFVGLAIFSNAIAAEPSLRNTLEKTLRSYAEVCKSGDVPRFEKTMSSYRLGTMKNHMASARVSLTPDIVKSVAGSIPDISTAEFVSLLEKGHTAGLVYVKEASAEILPSGKAKDKISFIFIKFVKEESDWKIDICMTIGAYKFQDDGTKTVFDLASRSPGEQIDGVVRSAPVPIPMPDIAAFLNLFCYGYKAQVTVNGIEQEAVADRSRNALLIGGLRNGKNTVVIVLTPTKKTQTTPVVKILRVLEDRKSTEVFKFEPKENIEGTHTFDFTIDK